MPPSWLKRKPKTKASKAPPLSSSAAPITLLRDAERRRREAMALQASVGNVATTAIMTRGRSNAVVERPAALGALLGDTSPEHEYDVIDERGADTSPDHEYDVVPEGLGGGSALGNHYVNPDHYGNAAYVPEADSSSEESSVLEEAPPTTGPPVPIPGADDGPAYQHYVVGSVGEDFGDAESSSGKEADVDVDDGDSSSEEEVEQGSAVVADAPAYQHYVMQSEIQADLAAMEDASSSEEDWSSSEEELPAQPVARKYATNLVVPAFHAMESVGGDAQDDFVRQVVHGGLHIEAKRAQARGGLTGLPPLKDMTAQQFLANPAYTTAAMREVYGWTERDVRKHWKADSAMSSGAKVKYLDADKRAKFAVVPGVTMKRPTGRAFDTKRHVSKAAGAGYAIYVMDGDGKLYSSGHRVGLFHHSSFLAGANAAGAGEMKVEGGKLTAITNKSGHYMPTPEHLQTVLGVLHEAGVPLADVTAFVYVKENSPPVKCNAEDFRINGRGATPLK